MNELDERHKPTGGCTKCRHCEKVRGNYYCDRTRIPYKAVHNERGYCSKFEPRGTPCAEAENERLCREV